MIFFCKHCSATVPTVCIAKTFEKKSNKQSEKVCFLFGCFCLKLLIMDFPCRGENCKKSFSTKLNRNRYKKVKKHGPVEVKTKIPFNETSKLYNCPTDGCIVESKYKHNVLKHLKLCDQLRKKKKIVTMNKVGPICSKVFAQKSNRDRHVEVSCP